MFKPFKTNAPEVEWNELSDRELAANRRRAMSKLIEQHRNAAPRRNRFVQFVRDLLELD